MNQNDNDYSLVCKKCTSSHLITWKQSQSASSPWELQRLDSPQRISLMSTVPSWLLSNRSTRTAPEGPATLASWPSALQTPPASHYRYQRICNRLIRALDISFQVSFFFFIYNEMVSEQTICMISFLPAKTVCCYIVQFLRRMKETIIHAIKLIML
jgi:hypothetical protein